MSSVAKQKISMISSLRLEKPLLEQNYQYVFVLRHLPNPVVVVVVVFIAVFSFLFLLSLFIQLHFLRGSSSKHNYGVCHEKI